MKNYANNYVTLQIVNLQLKRAVLISLKRNSNTRSEYNEDDYETTNLLQEGIMDLRRGLRRTLKSMFYKRK